MGRNKIDPNKKLKTESVSLLPPEIKNVEVLADVRGWTKADVLRYCVRVGLQVIAQEKEADFVTTPN